MWQLTAASAATATGFGLQQVHMRQKLLRIGCATTESDWLLLPLTDQQVRDLVIVLLLSESLSKRLSDLQIRTTS